MTSESQSIWLEQAAVSFGVIACGVCGTDRAALAKTSHEQFTEPKVQEMMLGIADMVEALRKDNIATQRVCWIFEKNRLYCATREDGSICAVVVAKDFDAGPMVDYLMTEFHEAT